MDQKNKVRVYLHDFDAKSNCYAKVKLLESDTDIDGFKIVQTAKGSLSIQLPKWMNNVWSYPDITIGELKEVITKIYFSVINKYVKNNPQPTATKQKNPPLFEIYDVKSKTEAMANVTILSTQKLIKHFYVSQEHDFGDPVNVNIPAWMNGKWECSDMEWEAIHPLIDLEFRRQVLKEDVPTNDEISVFFKDAREVSTCMVAASLPINIDGSYKEFRGFKVRKYTNGYIQVSPPSKIKRWESPVYPWHVLSQLILETIKKELGWENTYTPNPKAESTTQKTAPITDKKQSADSTNPDTPKKVYEKKETTALGRIRNAENSSLKFYPHSVIRLINSEKAVQKKHMLDLATSIARGAGGDIGIIEINMLEWIASMKFSTTNLFADLIEAGYISTEKTININKKKLNDRLKRMENYDLINITHFTVVDDEGNATGNSTAVNWIFSIGSTGHKLLRTLGKEPAKFDSFDILQDGNTVKRYLSANQCLVYWLTNYKEAINDNYRTSYILYGKGANYTGARIYTTVEVNNVPLVCESVRRCEDFETESNNQWTIDKINRIANIFDKPDQIYEGANEYVYSQRPIIQILCEDDEHMAETYNILMDTIASHKDQIFWFTTDLNVFNKDVDGPRFYSAEEDGLCPVDVDAFLGIEKQEAESEDLILAEA